MLRARVVLFPGQYREAIQLTPWWTEASMHITDVEQPSVFVEAVRRREARMPLRGMQRRGKIWEPPWPQVVVATAVFVPDPYRIHRDKQPSAKRRASVTLVPPSPDPAPTALVRRKNAKPRADRRSDPLTNDVLPSQAFIPQATRRRVIQPRPRRGKVWSPPAPLNVNLVPAVFTFVAQPLLPQSQAPGTNVTPRKRLVPPRPRARRTPDVPTPTQGDALPQAIRKRVVPPRRQRRAQGAPFYPAVPPVQVQLVPAVFTFVAMPLAPQEVNVATEVIPRKNIIPPRPRPRRVLVALPPTPDSPPPAPQAIRRRLTPPRPKRRAGGGGVVPRVTVNLVPATFTFVAQVLSPQEVTAGTNAVPRKRIIPPRPRPRRTIVALPPMPDSPPPPPQAYRRRVVVRRPQRRGHVAPLNFAAEVNLVPATFTFIAQPLSPQEVTVGTEVIPRRNAIQPRPRRGKVWDAPPAQAQQQVPPQAIRRREQPSRRIAHRGAQTLPVIVTPGNLAPAVFTFIAQPLNPTTFTFLSPSRKRVVPPRPRARRAFVTVIPVTAAPIVVPTRRRKVVRRKRRVVAFVPTIAVSTVNLVPATFTFVAQPLQPTTSFAPRVVRARRWQPPRKRRGRVVNLVPVVTTPGVSVNLVPAVFTFVAQPLLDSVACAIITFDDPDAEITFEDGTATTDCEEGTATITFDDGEADLSCDDGEATITFDPGCED